MADPTAAHGMLSRLPPEMLIQVIGNVLRERPELAPAVVAIAVPDLTYAPARAFAERRARGKVKAFRSTGRFGFIDCPELRAVFGQDVWVHEKQLNGIPIGTEVTFAVALSKENKPQAYDILIPDPLGGHDRPVALAFGQSSYPTDAKGAGKACGKTATSNVAPPVIMNSGWGQGKGHSAPPPQQGVKRPFPKGSDGPEVPPERVIGMYTGSVKNYTDKGTYGYAFVECGLLKSQGYTQDVYLHQFQMNGAKVGQEVRFTAYLNNKNLPQAKDVEVLGTGGTPPPPGPEAGYDGSYDAGYPTQGPETGYPTESDASWAGGGGEADAGYPGGDASAGAW